jgi:hypothetical protein
MATPRRHTQTYHTHTCCKRTEHELCSTQRDGKHSKSDHISKDQDIGERSPGSRCVGGKRKDSTQHQQTTGFQVRPGAEQHIPTTHQCLDPATAPPTHINPHHTSPAIRAQRERRSKARSQAYLPRRPSLVVRCWLDLDLIKEMPQKRPTNQMRALPLRLSRPVLLNPVPSPAMLTFRREALARIVRVSQFCDEKSTLRGSFSGPYTNTASSMTAFP